MTKLTAKEWKEYYPMIDAMTRGIIKSPLIIVTENLNDIPKTILNKSVLINNLKKN